MSEVITIQDLETLKKHEIFEAEVITGKAGGLSTGAEIDYATNTATGQVQKTMPAILRDIGIERIGDFTTGCTVTARNQGVLEVGGSVYVWLGALPKVVPAMSTPGSTGGISPAGDWLDVGDASLRSDLSEPLGVKKVTNASMSAPTIAAMIGLPLSVGDIISLDGYHNVMDYSHHKRIIAATNNGSGVQLSNGLWANILHDGSVNLKWFGAVALTESKVQLQIAADYANANRVPIVLDAIFYSTASVICGSAGAQNYVAFQGPTIANQITGQLGGVYFTGCDGFRIVQKTILGLSGLDIRGDGTTAIPASYGDYLKALIYSAFRSNEDTMDRNCVAFVNNCHFQQWRFAFDQSRGSWSSHHENNDISHCYQAGKHYRPHSSRIVHNRVSYSIRGFELIEQSSGEFHNNELNTGKYTEWLIKHVMPNTVSCCNNYFENWEPTDSVDPAANYGLGYIPIVVENDRFATMSDVKIDNNQIIATGAYCGILMTPVDAQKASNTASPMLKPRGNSIVGTTYAQIVVASTGTGHFVMDGMSGSIAPYNVKTAKLNGATGNVYFCGPSAVTVFEKEYLTRADVVAAVNAPLFGSADITKDTSFEWNANGVTHITNSRNKVKIRLFVEAKTDATAAMFRVTLAKFNAVTRTYEFNIPANSSVPITIDFVQTTPWDAIQDFSFLIQSVTTQPTYLRVHAVREFVSNY